MNRLLASVALSITSLGLGAGINGCSGAPTDAVSSSSEGLTLSCPYAFTAAGEAEDCRPIGGKMTCTREMECLPVVGDPASPLASNPTLTVTPIPPAAALAGLGCTWGVAITGRAPSNIWACPASATIPGNLGAAPSCPTSPTEPWDGGTHCEWVSFGAYVSPNSIVGEPKANWILVQESIVPWPYDIGTSCLGGCPVVGDPPPNLPLAQ